MEISTLIIVVLAIVVVSLVAWILVQNRRIRRLNFRVTKRDPLRQQQGPG